MMEQAVDVMMTSEVGDDQAGGRQTVLTYLLTYQPGRAESVVRQRREIAAILEKR